MPVPHSVPISKREIKGKISAFGYTLTFNKVCMCMLGGGGGGGVTRDCVCVCVCVWREKARERVHLNICS